MIVFAGYSLGVPYVNYHKVYTKHLIQNAILTHLCILSVHIYSFSSNGTSAEIAKIEEQIFVAKHLSFVYNILKIKTLVKTLLPSVFIHEM